MIILQTEMAAAIPIQYVREANKDRFLCFTASRSSAATGEAGAGCSSPEQTIKVNIKDISYIGEH